MPIGTVGADGILRRTDRPDTFRGPETAPSFLSPRFNVGGGNRAAEEAEAYRERAEREREARSLRIAPVGRRRSPAVAHLLASVKAGADRKRREAIAGRREAEAEAEAARRWAEAVAVKSGR